MQPVVTGKSVLLWGCDELLTETRGLLLARAGFSVWDHTRFDPEHPPADRAPDLIVLCHSVSRAAQEHLATQLRHAWPATRILLLSSRPEVPPSVDAVLMQSVEPARLVEVAVRLVS